MKSLIFFSIFFTSSFFISAQNLIQNSSFEDYSSCPIGSGQLWKASHWVGQSCELYNICAPAYTISSPYCNIYSFQTPNNENGFAGFHPYFESLEFGRELIYQKITSNLIPNRWYCSSLFTNLADGSRYGIDCIEIYLSEDSINYYLGFANLPIEAQIKNKNGILSDTSNWIFIEGAFQANGNELFFYIGCFALNNDVHKEWFNYSFFSVLRLI